MGFHGKDQGDGGHGNVLDAILKIIQHPFWWMQFFYCMLNMNHICKACLKMKMHLEHHQVDSIKPRIATDHEVLMAPEPTAAWLGIAACLGE